MLAAPFAAPPAYQYVAKDIDQSSLFGATGAHGAQRLEIYDFVARYSMNKPILGHGLDAAREIKDFDSKGKFMQESQISHPHNFALQLWLELGLIGVLLAGFFIQSLLASLGKRESLSLSYFSVFLIGLCAYSFSYGLWQAWMIAAIVVAVMLLRMISRAYPDANTRREQTARCVCRPSKDEWSLRCLRLAKTLKKSKKILIVRWGSMGDLVVCSAVMEDICRHFQNAEIHLNVEPPWHKLFKHDPRFSKLQVMKIRKAPRVSSAVAWIKMLRQEQYDLIIDLQCNDRSRLLLSFARLVCAAPKLSIATKPAFPYRLSPPQYAKGSHAIDITRAAAKGLGIECLMNKPMIHWDSDTEQSTQALLAHHRLESGRFVILVPGSKPQWCA